MRYLSVCSGIEAATCAWHPLGWTPVAFSEIEPFPCAALAQHYPTVPNWGDMTRYQEWPDAAFDVLVGGTPCQSFSVAGLRRGMADPRGNLALVYLGIADRYRPEWLVWENVPGVLSSNRGRDFGAFLGALGELGYGWAYRVLDAQYFGLAQRRKRVFVVGHIGDWRRAAAVLFEPASLRGDSAPRREARERVAASLSAGSNPGSNAAGRRREDDVNLVAHALRASNGGIDREDSHTLIAHTLRAEGFDASEDGTGRGIPLTVGALTVGAHNGGGSTARTPTPTASSLARCLNAGGMGRQDYETETLVPVRTGGGFDVTAFSSKDHGADAGELAPTLRAMPHDESHANGGGQVAIAYGWQNSAQQGASASEHITPSLDKSKIPAVGVRRLTPRECERLQGFPDDYTLTPYRGKAAKDDPRYKALGNSMAVPCMAWIGRRIAMTTSAAVPHAAEAVAVTARTRPADPALR